MGVAYDKTLSNSDSIWFALTYQKHDEWAARALDTMDSEDESYRIAGRYIHQWGNGSFTRVSAMWENIEFDVEVKTETPEPTATNRPANRYEQLEEYLVQTRSWDQTEQEEDVQLPDSVETAQLDIQTGKITTPEPTEQPKPNFIVREPIQDQEDPEKKN